MGQQHYLQGLSREQLTDNSGCQPISLKLSRPLGFKSLVAIFHHGGCSVVHNMAVLRLESGVAVEGLTRVSQTTKWQSQHVDPHFHISPWC